MACGEAVGGGGGEVAGRAAGMGCPHSGRSLCYSDRGDAAGAKWVSRRMFPWRSIVREMAPLVCVR